MTSTKIVYLSVLLLPALLIGSCTSDTGILGPVLGGVGGPRNCTYPAEPHGMSTGDVMPPYSWMGAVLPDGSTTDFSIEDFHCSTRYDDYRSLVLFMGAEWCGACPSYIAFLHELASTFAENGTLVAYLESENLRREPESCEEAAAYLEGYIGEDGPGIRLGDGDNTNGSGVADGGGPIPTAWFVRRSDMRIVAYQREFGSRLPMAELSADPDRDWSDTFGGAPSTNCEEGDEEASEPNDRPTDAVSIEPGTHHGGICNTAADYYRIEVAGAWTAELTFDHDTVDLDLVVRSDNGDVQAMSNGEESLESVMYSGPAYLEIVAKNPGSTGPYDLTIR